jgi:MYXO-CTERM domain-containing protein
MDFINDVQPRHPDLLLVPGFEYTTYWGHANAIGATQWVDFMIASTPSDTIEAGTDGILSQGAIMSINHPVLNLGNTCIGCAWMLMEQPERIGAVEIQNGQYSATGAAFYRQSTVFWESFLSRGLHVAPLGGSDDHSGGQDTGALSSPIGGPTTMVYARELSVAAIMEGVRAGHTVVKLQGPTDPMVELSAGTAIVGDTVHDRHVTLSVTITHGMGGTLQFVHNGMTQTTTVAVDADPFTTTLPVDAPPGTQEDRWRCQLLMNGKPSVVTGHLWVAATGDPIPQDAGAPTDASGMGDAGAMDAGNPGMDGGSGMHAGGACGCATVPAKSPAGLGALAMLGLLAVRRRRWPRH